MACRVSTKWVKGTEDSRMCDIGNNTIPFVPIDSDFDSKFMDN